MKELEYHLGEMKPRTMLLARELVRVAITILAHRRKDPNPESYLGNGPVLDILHNVARRARKADAPAFLSA
jgi:hypothetical protein